MIQSDTFRKGKGGKFNALWEEKSEFCISKQFFSPHYNSNMIPAMLAIAWSLISLPLFTSLSPPLCLYLSHHTCIDPSVQPLDGESPSVLPGLSFLCLSSPSLSPLSSFPRLHFPSNPALMRSTAS